MAIKIIFCDIGNVLIRNDTHELYQKYQDRYQIDSQKLQSVFQYLHSAKRTPEQLQNYLKSQDISLDIWKQFSQDLYTSEFRNQPLVGLLEELKANSRISIVCTTNNVSDVTSILKKFQLDDLPDLIVSSASLGVTKPSPEYWYQAVKMSQTIVPVIQYQEVLVIDDSSTNIQSAKDFGFQTVHYIGNQSDSEISSLCQENSSEEKIILNTDEDIDNYFSNLK